MKGKDILKAWDTHQSGIRAHAGADVHSFLSALVDGIRGDLERRLPKPITPETETPETETSET